ncbi:MAG: xanthine dehydrogenase family protein molybdopterin-binding subunit [Betaproteobacteria bacterium]|nr:xanthine dehydrogenase family protein molybdopterin-binding subunit [Betaproteobacteria bacterium]
MSKGAIAGNRFGIGQPVRRVEDERFLTGRGRYLADINLDRQAYAVAVMSPHAHARILSVDTTAARAAPGVLCVLTGADAIADGLGGYPPLFMPSDKGGPPGYRTLRPLLVADRVRFVGDRVAFVVAETLEQARDAAERVEVDYETLPAAVTLQDAAREDATRLWDDCAGNVSFELEMGDPAATDTAFAAAAHTVSLRLASNRLSPSAIEPRAAIGDHHAADDSYTLHTSSQNPHGARTMLARAIFRIPETKLRVISPDVGGGFGLKTNPGPEDGLVLWASRRCGRPVKWIATRAESMLGDTHGRDQVMDAAMALDKVGRILAIRARGMQALGAYVFAAGVSPIDFSLTLIPNVYRVPCVHLVSRGMFTNTAPLSAYRGAGRPEAAFVTERLLDEAAHALAIDPVEIRRRNFIPASAMPYATPTGMSYDSGEFEQVMDKCLALAKWPDFPQRRAASEKNGRLRGRGLSYYIESGGRFNDRMELRFDPGGNVTIVAGTHSHGQGHATTYAQLVSDWLGLPFENIRFVQGDTDQVPFGRGTFAARSSMIGGCALKLAADAIIEKARPMAAHLMEAASDDVEFHDGQFHIVGTDRAMPMAEVARAFFHPVGMPRKFGVGLDASGSWAAEPWNHPNGCHVCEVEVDSATGVVTIARYTVVDDVGMVINPMICEGQVHGGLAQGIGQALLEEVIYDRETGQLLTGSFMDYGMPRADDFPDFTLAFEEIPATTNPLGIKGIGEAGTVGSTAAVINAVLDALRPLGVVEMAMPATPARVWEALQRARAG